jgi:hypothetical protein
MPEPSAKRGRLQSSAEISLIRKTIFFLFGLTGAVLLSQFPEFFQQYAQRVGGHLSELNHQVGELENRAALDGKDTGAYLRHLTDSEDRAVRREGRNLVALVERRDRLTTAYEVLATADPWWRAPHFLRHIDWTIAGATLQSYRLAMPITAESALYSAAGFLLGIILYGLLFRRRRRVSRET